MKQLIVNADDYGLSTAINAGIIDAHQNGIVTSTTIMAGGQALDDGVARLRDAPSLDTGCHLVLIDGAPIAQPSQVRSLLDASGRFPRSLASFIANVAGGRARHTEMVIELRAQLDRLLGLGFTLSHCDSHKHTHAHPRVLDAVLEAVDGYGIPCLRNPFEELPWSHLRVLSQSVTDSVTLLKRRSSAAMMNVLFGSYFEYRMQRAPMRTPDFFLGFVVTGRLQSTLMAELLTLVRDGVNELVCHPARVEMHQPVNNRRLKLNRVSELEALCSTEARQAINNENIVLLGFRSLAAADSHFTKR